MLLHTVMWKFKETAEGHTRAENIATVRKGLTSLVGVVPAIESLQFYENEVVCDRNFDAMLQVTVRDEAALEAYKTHPAHQKVAAFVAKVTEGRAAVDITAPPTE